MNIDPAKPHQISEHKCEAPLLCCVFDPTGRFILAGGRDRGVICLSSASGNVTMLHEHQTWVGAIVRSGMDLVLSADYAGHVIAWDCSGDTPKLRWNIEAHSNSIYSLAASADGTHFATGDRDGTIRIWQAVDGRRITEIAGLAHPIYGVVFHPDGRRLISADRQPQKPRLKLWELATGKELQCIEVSRLSAYRRVEDIEWGGIRGMTISPDGKTLVACGSNGYSGPACALLFRSATGELEHSLASTLKGYYYASRFHSQGFLITVGGDVAKGEIRIWNPDKEESVVNVPTPGPCTSVDIHPDGQRFVIAQTMGKGSYPDSGMLTQFDWM